MVKFISACNHLINEYIQRKLPLASVDDPDFIKKLTDLYQEGLSDCKISECFQVDGIKIRYMLYFALLLTVSSHLPPSKTSVKCWCKELGLHGSKSDFVKNLPAHVKEQIVLNQLDKDPTQKQGLATIKAKVNFDQNICLPHLLVSSIMHMHNSDSFTQHGPNSNKILHFPKNPVSINEWWSANGHDKLYHIGFPVWAVVDDATAHWLSGWVVPSNPMGDIIAFLYLSLIEKMGGMFFLLYLHCEC